MAELVIGTILLGILMVSAYSHELAKYSRDQAVKRSLERQFAAAQTVYMAIATILSSCALGILLKLSDMAEPSVILMAFAALWLLVLLSDLEDDDWRNGQGQQLKDTAKNIGTRLSARLSPRLL